MFSYLFRLVCLSLACFFLANLMFTMVVALLAPVVIRLAGRIRPRRAASLLFAIRMAPLGLSAILVIGLCIPSYLELEPDTTVEPVGFACLSAAMLGALMWSVSIVRASRSVLRSLRYVRECELAASKTLLAGDPAPVWVVDGMAPLIALAGIVRSRLVISRSVIRVLSTGQLTAALRHERAHQAARDNVKRMAMVLAPDAFPFAHAFSTIDKAWARFTEWAADDWAVGGNPEVSLSLATALVRVARISSSATIVPLVSTFHANGNDLSERVNRLLRAASERPKPEAQRPAMLAAATLTLATCAATVLLQPGLQSAVHTVLERLVR